MTCPYGDLVPAAALTALAAVPRSVGTGSPAEQAAAASALLVNRAPLVGDGANVWMLGQGQSVDDFIRVDDFLRWVAPRPCI